MSKGTSAAVTEPQINNQSEVQHVTREAKIMKMNNIVKITKWSLHIVNVINARLTGKHTKQMVYKTKQ